jgi:hypothetical protein
MGLVFEVGSSVSKDGKTLPVRLSFFLKMSVTKASVSYGIYNPLVLSAAPCIGVAIQTQELASLPALRL